MTTVIVNQLELMEDNIEQRQEPDGMSDQTTTAIPAASDCSAVFQPTDWVSFGLATVVALGIYLWTLAPDVNLGSSGIFSVGAMYAGVPFPPGYPLWTIYAWLFTVLLPFSNIAWRVAVSSAVAASLACGLIALMVSRGGASISEGIPGLRRLEPKEQNALRVVSGVVAGMAFGFDGGFWCRAVIADPWALSLLLLSTVLCLLMGWLQNPGRKRYLYAAFFVYGLTLTNSELLISAAMGLQILVMFGDSKLGRDLFFANIVGALALAVVSLLDLGRFGTLLTNLQGIYISLGVISAVLCIGLAVKNHGVLTEWKTVSVGSVLCLLGAAMYFYEPLASMSNPPVNWGYPRSVEGLFHLVSRGQYEPPHLTASWSRLAEQIQLYWQIAVSEFGLVYLLAAVVPLVFLHKMRARERGWMLGLLAVYLCLALLVPVVLNPSLDRQSRELHKVLLSTSHLVLAIWTGYGLTLLGFLLAGRPAGDGSYRP